MDIQIPFIFVALFSLASVLLIFIYKFGIKEKSYEEALAEQRQQSHILLGIKPKPKEKKSKKTSKKVKEKSTVDENEVVDELEQAELIQKNNETQKKLHVEFKEVAEDAPAKIVTSKKQMKKEKVRPILIHKEKVEIDLERVNTDSVTYPTNHFEELQPKDDFELFRSINGEEELKEETVTDVAKIDAGTQKQITKKQPETETAIVQKEDSAPLVTPPLNGFIGNTGKEKKKKKSEYNTLQQLAGSSNGPNMPVLLNLVRKAELSRSEVQILIDLLLNKQHEAPAILDEWSEGKSDPVQKLKKQLAEKEKMLLEEQQITASAQAKLREIRSDYQNEKVILQQKLRSLEEMMQTKQIEASRLHQQVQQLQGQIKDEQLRYQQLREELAAVQMQRQQFEIRLSQNQESEGLINQLQSEIQELSSVNNQLRIELTHFTEENNSEKERNQSFIIQLTNFQKELEQTSERNRQLEETRTQMERDLENVLKQENDLKSEISQLNSVIQQQNEELRRLDHGKKQYFDDLQKHKDESSKLINQLKSDLRQVQDENMQMQVTHMNGSVQENKQHEVEILNLHNELSSIKTQLNQAEKTYEAELKTANAIANNLRHEIEELKVKFEEEKSKLEVQKVKNNELRTKNWKVMEALNAVESRITNNISLIQTKSEKDVQREFIQRLFPEIKNKEIVNAEVFAIEGEQFIQKYVDNLRKHTEENVDADVHQLKLQLQHYKSVIDNTEKMLNKLQKHIEQEEINWRTQLAAKTTELESLKESYGQELQERLASLEVELRKEREDKNTIIAQFQELKNSTQIGLNPLDLQNTRNGVH